MKIEIKKKGDSIKAKQDILAAVDRCLLAKDCVVTIEPAKKSRSNAQNASLWGVAYPVIKRDTDYEPERVHRLMCGEYFGWKNIKTFSGYEREPVRTTTKNEEGKPDVISTTDCADFYLFIQAFCSEWSVDIPDPDPNWYKE